jgi:hypothetical protein
MKNNPWQRIANLKLAFNLKPTQGYVMEFGVGRGGSLRVLRDLTVQQIHAFDSFDGLPEDWEMSDEYVVKAGDFKYDKPKGFNNVIFHEGWFEDTIPEWKNKYPAKISFLHIDSDLYSSAKTVLTELNERIVSGTILVFDDMYETERYQNWENGEYKAFEEWKAEYKRRVQEINRTDDGESSFRVL